MNSSLSDLNALTACGKALQDRGGTIYTQGCKPYTNIAPWDIVCTPGGNLSCQYVIHAVCGNWNAEEKQRSEQVVDVLIIIPSYFYTGHYTWLFEK